MSGEFNEQIMTSEGRSTEQPDAQARCLLVIITSVIVLTLAGLEIWLLVTR